MQSAAENPVELWDAAVTLSAHVSAAFGVHVPGGLGGDAGACGRGSGVRAGVGSGMAEAGGEGRRWLRVAGHRITQADHILAAAAAWQA
jgi:hypothetical protein